MSNVRWTIVVPESTYRELRTFLGKEGMRKGDISRFVEEAVRARLFELSGPFCFRKQPPHLAMAHEFAEGAVSRFLTAQSTRDDSGVNVKLVRQFANGLGRWSQKCLASLPVCPGNEGFSGEAVRLGFIFVIILAGLQVLIRNREIRL